MTPAAKSGLTWLAAMLLVALVFAVRYQIVQGRFQSVGEIGTSACQTVAAGLPGVQDVVADSAHSLLLFSAHGVKPDPRDGLYTLSTGDPAARPVRLAGTPKDFHPTGLDLAPGPDGSQTLSAIDTRQDGASVAESYGLTYAGANPGLAQQISIRSGLMVSPSDLVSLGPDIFYLVNDRVSRNAFGRFAEDYLLWPRADVVAFGGLGVHIAVQRLAGPRSILARGRFLYVSTHDDRRVLAFSREDFTGNLSEIGSLSLPARLERMSLDASGDLIVAGESQPGTAQVFRVTVGADGAPKSYQTLFSDDGRLMQGASAAIVAGSRLFLGSASDSKLLACTIK